MASNGRIAAAEALGTAVLMIGGPGSAVLATTGTLSIGIAGVALAFGLSLMVMAYTIGSTSGCHINPAVTVGSWVNGGTQTRQLPWYLGGQVIGALVGAAIVFAIASGIDSFSAAESGFASNGYGDHSPAGYNLLAVAITEIVLTAVFVLVVLATARKSMAAGFTGLTVGLTLTLVHLVSIPVSNTSVNPARSLGTAVFQGGWAVEQLWAFIVFPLAGAVIAGFASRFLITDDDRPETLAADLTVGDKARVPAR